MHMKILVWLVAGLAGGQKPTSETEKEEVKPKNAFASPFAPSIDYQIPGSLGFGTFGTGYGASYPYQPVFPGNAIPGGEGFGRPYPGIGPDIVGPPVFKEPDCNVVYGNNPLDCFAKSEFYSRKFVELQQYFSFLPQMVGTVPACAIPDPQTSFLINVSTIQQQCLGPTYAPRIPFHLYNVRGEMRFIVQFPPNLQQCYLEALCKAPPGVCGSLGFRPRPPCKNRICFHTLLAWDPAAPHLGPFFDSFPYNCCCHCTTNVLLPLAKTPNIYARLLG